MYVDIASIYTDMCIVIVCDSAQLFHYSNPQKDGFYSNFHLFGRVLYIHISLSEDTKNNTWFIINFPSS